MNHARRVLHVISGLGTGGAENMLLRLVSAVDRSRYVPSVFALRGGPVATELRAQGVEVINGNFSTIWRMPTVVREITRYTRVVQPHVIQGWMNHGNLAAWYAARAVPRKAALLWGVRQSLYDIRYEKFPTRMVIRAEAMLSGSPDAIVFNSALAMSQHRAAGFVNACMEVIPNGFDVNVFRPNEAERLACRRELDIEMDAEVVGIVGRAHPMKDFKTFFSAMAGVLTRRPRVRVLAVGLGVRGLAPLVASEIPAELQCRVILLDERRQMETFYPALDVLCSTSLHGEGFPNVVAEAMACEVPCVVTDVGDAAGVVGESGVVVPRAEAPAVARAVITLLESGRAALVERGGVARCRVMSKFSIESVAARYHQLYDTLCKDR